MNAIVRPFEFKEGEEIDPTKAVNEALATLTATVDARLKAVETKSADENKLVDRLDKLEAKMQRPAAKENVEGEISLERKSFATYLRFGERAPVDEIKTLTVSSDQGGGYIAPNEISSEIIRDIVQFSPIRALASVRSTTAPSVSYPKRTGITNAAWHGETQEATESEPSFGQVDIPVRELNTYVDISNQLLADATAAEAEVRLALTQDFGAKEGLAFVSGAGNLQPEGLLTNADVSVTSTGNAATLGTTPADLLIDLMYALPAVYRNRGTWLLNGTTLAAIRKLKDSNGVYLWQPALTLGQPESILGRPVMEIPDMADVGAGTTPIMFGDIATAYRIIDRVVMSVFVDPFTQHTKGQTRIHATRRVGAAVVQPAAVRKVTCKVS